MINLGDEAEDKITGFKGTVFAKYILLFGMTTMSIQPQVEQYGHLPKSENFYETQLKIIKEFIVGNDKNTSDLVTKLKEIKKIK